MNSESIRLFDETAKDFAIGTDQLIERCCYQRGDLFVKAVEATVPRGGTLLDYGCGPGRLAALLAKSGFQVHGVDTSTGMVSEARRAAPAGVSLSFEVITDRWMDDPQPKYDGIVCSSVIEYSAHPIVLLSNLRLRLKERGMLIITFANKSSLWRTYSRMRNPGARYRQFQHHLWTGRTFDRLLKQSGFQPQSKPIYFEAALFDRHPNFHWLSRNRWIGTLGLVIAMPIAEQ